MASMARSLLRRTAHGMLARCGGGEAVVTARGFAAAPGVQPVQSLPADKMAKGA